MSLCEIYSIKYEPFFDSRINKYINILSISEYPKGKLNKIVNKVYKEKLSDKEIIDGNGKCIFVLMSFTKKSQYMLLSEIPSLYAYLKNNNYVINHVDLKWENRTVCFVEHFIN